eukprot:67167_1
MDSKMKAEFNKMMQPIMGLKSKDVYHDIPMFSTSFNAIHNTISTFTNPTDISLQISEGYNYFENVSILQGKYVFALFDIRNCVKIKNGRGVFDRLNNQEYERLEQLLTSTNDNITALKSFFQWRHDMSSREKVRIYGADTAAMKKFTALIAAGKRFCKSDLLSLIRREAPYKIKDVKEISEMSLIQQVVTGYDDNKYKFLMQIQFDTISITRPLDGDSDEESEEESDTEISDDDDDDDECDMTDDDEQEYTREEKKYRHLHHVYYKKGDDLLSLDFENNEEEQIVTSEMRELVFANQPNHGRPAAKAQKFIVTAQYDNIPFTTVLRWLGSSKIDYANAKQKLKKTYNDYMKNKK